MASEITLMVAFIKEKEGDSSLDEKMIFSSGKGGFFLVFVEQRRNGTSQRKGSFAHVATFFSPNLNIRALALA